MARDLAAGFQPFHFEGPALTLELEPAPNQLQQPLPLPFPPALAGIAPRAQPGDGSVGALR